MSMLYVVHWNNPEFGHAAADLVYAKDPTAAQLKVEYDENDPIVTRVEMYKTSDFFAEKDEKKRAKEGEAVRIADWYI